jgi:hypothetical protein
MADDEPEISVLDARLAEIDRRLSTIQTGLAEDEAALAEPPRALATPAAPVAPAAEGQLVAQLRELAATQERMIEALRDLLEHRATSANEPVSLTAGPFASTEALRAFERGLQALPGVRAVELRGFEGGDRAVIDVHLS